MDTTPISHSNTTLAGLIVVERAGRLAAGVTTMLLARLGATVLRFDAPVGRPAADPPAWHEHPLALAGKSRIPTTGSPATDAARWEELAARADVIVQSLAGDEPVVARPAALTCAFSAFGLAGGDGYPRNAHEFVLQAAAGMFATTGEASSRPQPLRLPMLELFAGINGAASCLAALRAGGGRGHVLDLAVYDSASALLGTFHSIALTDPARRFRDGCRHPLNAPWNAYRTTDGWFVLCIASNEQWHRLLELVGQPGLKTDPRFGNNHARVDHVDAVDAVVTQWSERHTTADAIAALHAIAMPASAVATIPEVTAALAREGKLLGDAGSTRWMAPPLGLAAGCAAVPATASGSPGSAPGAIPDNNAAGKERRGFQAGPPRALPLAGVRVIEVGPYTAGPIAGRYLADLGADVIKVEPAGGENSRAWPPLFGNTGGYFAHYNAGKRSVVLDLNTGADRERLWTLIDTADVLHQNLKPGALEKLGFGYDAVRVRKPDIVYSAISGYGANGPRNAALDTVIQASCGVMCFAGQDGRTDATAVPIKSGFSLADLLAGHVAALSMLAALAWRERTGAGQFIDVAMQDALAWTTQTGWDEGSPAFPDTAVLACADGWIAVALPPAQAERGYADRCVARSRADAARLIAADGVACAPVLEIHEALGSEPMSARGLLRWLPQHDGAKTPVLVTPHRWNESLPPAIPPIGPPDSGG